jgi:GGDEF domain-containing protein
MNNPVNLENGPVTITASFGIAMADLTMAPDKGGYIDILIRNADIALYRAKSTGRNRVVCYSALEVSDLGNGN